VELYLHDAPAHTAALALQALMHVYASIRASRVKRQHMPSSSSSSSVIIIIIIIIIHCAGQPAHSEGSPDANRTPQLASTNPPQCIDVGAFDDIRTGAIMPCPEPMRTLVQMCRVSIALNAVKRPTKRASPQGAAARMRRGQGAPRPVPHATHTWAQTCCCPQQARQHTAAQAVQEC
jgi:hypothetical protein